MRIFFTGLVIFLFASHMGAQTDNPLFDQKLADSLGADEYGMKSYVLVLLKTGPANITNKVVLDSLFTNHLKNIKRLADEGKMVVAGPLGENDKKYEGIFILNAATIEEAKELLKTDPAIRTGLLDTELYQWYGSAALPVYLSTHNKVQKKNF